ncbi:MAG: HIT family protein [Saprospiraceae bacterium]|uniref:HIT family protein n=1 Tax=Candidatus Opimibacter skivensis TaxID=2982028 RepID=A0A9D7SW74_9BACT|nr:HIT family protein [Candidatus Opimibacter skivensis]
MSTIFSKIISGEIPCHKVAEDDRCLAFLDIRPVVFGHTLVIPKIEVNYYFDLDDDYLCHLNLFAKKVAKVLDQEIDCLRVGVMIAGLEVPHAHIHLIPINSIADLSFTNKRVEVSSSDMADLAKKLSASFKTMNE